MRAIEYRKCGAATVLELQHDRPAPQLLEKTVRVHVEAAGINPIDCKIRSNSGMRASFGISLPAVPGYDFSGTIEELGSAVTDFRVGDAVFGMLSLRQPGSYAEYVVVPVDQIVRKPPNISFEEAAGLPLAGLSALQLLTRARALTSNARVLINGASGGVGSLAVQIARAHGALVTGVTSTRNTALVEQLGATTVIDYTKQPLPGDGKYDAIIDTVGNLGLRRARAALVAGGIYASCAPTGKIFAAVMLTWFAKKRTILNIVRPRGSDLNRLVELVSANGVRPPIDASFAMEQAAEAHRYLETGRARGKVVLRIAAATVHAS